MSWARASSAARSMACPASTVLQSIDKAGDAAIWGKFCHSWVETGGFVKQKEMTDKQFDAACTLLGKKIVASGIQREELWPLYGSFEVPFGINCVKEEVLQVENVEGWRDRFGEEWATGTIDYSSELLGDAWCDDLKTGRHLPHRDDPQIMMYCLARWLLDDKPSVIRFTLTHWPKYPIDQPPNRYDVSKEHWQIERFYQQLRLAYQRHTRAKEHQLENRIDEWAWAGLPYQWTWATRPPVEYTGQCTYCKSKQFCPKGDKR